MASQTVTYDNSDHIMRTTSQWADRAIANWPIPRGLLCIEILTDNTTKLKIGEGDKFYRELPYVGASGGGDWSNYYTKQQIDAIIRNMNYMSIASTAIYDSKERLPASGNRLGDVRFVRNPENPLGDPFEYMWNGSRWIPLGGSMTGDLSAYAKKSEVNPRLDALERVAHSHANKSILDRTSAAYTIAEQQKLADLKNYDDTEIKGEIADLESAKHSHPNLETLNRTTAAFTIADRTKLDNLQNYEPFIGTNGHVPGTEGLVPAPTTSDTNKYLASDGTWKPIASGGIQPATTTTLGGVIVGSGLNVDSNGLLSTTGGGGGGTEYAAGEGISIDEGSTTQDITALQWVQGSVRSDNGELDNTCLTAIRSPELETGLTQMLNVSAQSTDTRDMKWKAAFYDSEHNFISMSDTWQTVSGDATKPAGAAYFIIVLRKEPETPIDENSLRYCEISWPIEIGKYVITNTGVTHLEMNGSSLVSVENGSTSEVLSFSGDFHVSSGVVEIPDYQNLVLHVNDGE